MIEKSTQAQRPRNGFGPGANGSSESTESLSRETQLEGPLNIDPETLIKFPTHEEIREDALLAVNRFKDEGAITEDVAREWINNLEQIWRRRAAHGT